MYKLATGEGWQMVCGHHKPGELVGMNIIYCTCVCIHVGSFCPHVGEHLWRRVHLDSFIVDTRERFKKRPMPVRHHKPDKMVVQNTTCIYCTCLQPPYTEKQLPIG